MKKIYTLIFALLITSSTTMLLAWGTTGHRVIAEVAERNLSKKALKNVKDLLDDQHMAYWANWADLIKSDKTGRWNHTHVWHFVNAPANVTKAEYVEHITNLDQGNLFSAISELRLIVNDKQKTKEERKEALVFIIHLVGDLHQPMHAGREEDRGGNKIPVTWFGRKTNLHSLWDSSLINHEKYSYTEYATILNVLTKTQKETLQEGEVEDWLYESHSIADDLYDMTEPGEELLFEYNYKVRHIVDGQLQKGGLRLAKLLNELFK